MSESRLVNITLDERTLVRRSAEVEHERAVAIFDLLEENHFAPEIAEAGPYSLHLRLEENRLVFDIRDESDSRTMHVVGVVLNPFRRIVKDYFTVCESYYSAIKTASPSKIEAIDMGRRGLHNEGAAVLRDRLNGQIDIDEDTARRLFTLLCVLHIRG